MNSDSVNHRDETNGRSKLVAVVVLIVLLWGVVLPRLAETRRVQERERWIEENGIHPAAMFYTELPVLDQVLRRD